MQRQCASCGRLADPGDRFCSGCGAPLGDPSAADLTGTFTPLTATGAPSGPMPAVGSGRAPGLAAGSAALVVRRGPGEGAEHVLQGEVVTVGRSDESTLFLDDITVSRRHAEFVRTDAGWVVRDAGSLNGTYVNRVRVDEALLAGGDEVQIGKYRFVFLLPEDPLGGLPGGLA